MKGISAVLAVVLIVVITVAIIGMTYGWATGLFKITSEASGEQIEGITDDMQKSVSIVALKCDYYEATGIDTITVTLKATGTKNIEVEELTFIVDETVEEQNEEILEAGALDEFTFDVTPPHKDTRTLKVDAPAAPVEETVECLIVFGDV